MGCNVPAIQKGQGTVTGTARQASMEVPAHPRPRGTRALGHADDGAAAPGWGGVGKYEAEDVGRKELKGSESATKKTCTAWGRNSHASLPPSL